MLRWNGREHFVIQRSAFGDQLSATRLIQFEVDAEFEELGAGVGLAGDWLECVGDVGAAAKGMSEIGVELDGAVDEAARLGLGAAWIG